MPCHVEDAEGELAVELVTALEVGSPADAADVVGGDGGVGFIMGSESVEPFFFECPVFHDLGGEFNEVAEDVGAAGGTVGALGEHAVEGVPEFVQEGGHLVEGEEGGTGGGGLGEIGDNGDDGTDVLPLFPVLYPVVGHPGAAAFAFTGEEVGEEDGKEGTVAVVDFESADVGMVAGEIVHFLEGDAVEAMGEGENAFAYFLKGKVGTEEFVVEGIFFLFEFVGVVCPVPALQGLGEAGAAGKVLDFAFVGNGVGMGCGEELLQEAVDCGGRFRHAVGKDVVGIGGISQEACFFESEVDDLADDAVVVVRAALVASGGVSAVHAFAQGTAVGIAHEGDVIRGVEGEEPAFDPLRPGVVGSCFACGFGQTGEVGGVGEVEGESVGGSEGVFLEAEGKPGELGSDFTEACARFAFEVGASTHEHAVGVVEEGGLFGREGEGGAVVVDLLDTGKQLRVEGDAVAVFREAWGDALGNGLHLGGGAGRVEVEKDGGDGVKAGACGIERLDGVGKGGRLGVGGDALHIGLGFTDGSVEGGFVMFEADGFEGWHLERGGERRQ